jgi:hypothetical protein
MEKLKNYIKSEKVFNVQAICKKANIDRLHMHRFLNDQKELKDSEVKSLTKVMSKYGFKQSEKIFS